MAATSTVVHQNARQGTAPGRSPAMSDPEVACSLPVVVSPCKLANVPGRKDTGRSESSSSSPHSAELCTKRPSWSLADLKSSGLIGRPSAQREAGSLEAPEDVPNLETGSSAAS
mmetsp:Transcript_15230/g.27111  ORF Transcript_15230/g.27111 Transcript_15230/m.27111 type:complete len:114 (+) Transcript_15230:1096-1437(+)